MRPQILLPAALLFQLLSALPAAEPTMGQEPADRVVLRRDLGARRTEILVRTRGGEVAWADVLAALSRLQGFDDAALRGVLPRGSFEVGSFQARLALLGLNAALSPGLRLHLVRERESGQRALQVVVDHAALEARGRSLKRFVRRALLEFLEDGDANPRFGLFPDRNWREARPGLPLVVVIHGIGLPPRSLRTLVEAVREEGLPVAFFRYPGSQSIGESARLFSEELRAVARKEPARRVSVVAISMGGLVVRAAVEDPALDPGNITRLIMVGTPNRGSNLAALEPLLEVWTGLERAARLENPFRGALEDGLGEAGEDLRPGSSFLAGLNARPRNPRVRYSLFLGTGAPFQEADLAAARECLQQVARRNRLAHFFGRPVEDWLADLDEVVGGKGDAAVSVERGRLEGVEDTVLLGFDHLRMLDSRDPAARELRRGILERLRRAERP